MGLFSFGRKLEISKGYSLKEIPLFSSFSSSELRIIEKRTRLVEYRRGDTVYEEGKPADAFYVIVSGRFRVFQKTRGTGETKTLTFLYRGDYFGESSILTAQPHSASVEARSDSLLLRLEKEDFVRVLAEIPKLSIHLNRTLGHRLTKMESPARKKQEVKLVALYSTVSSPEESFHVLLDLATNLVHETKSPVVYIDFLPLPGDASEEFHRSARFRVSLSKIDPSRESDLKPNLMETSAGFQYLPIESEKSGEAEKKLSTLFTFLVYRFDYILIRLGREMGDFSFKALKHCDQIYLLLDPTPKGVSEAAHLIHELEKTFSFTRNEIKVILPEQHTQGAYTYYDEKEKALNTKIFQILPSRSEQPDRYHAAMRFVTKELAGTLVGLALGSGAAYGLSHIGVLRVLEKENIPIDVIAGCSMGALVGAFWGAGYNAGELEKIVKSLDKKSAFFKLIGFRDLSLAHHGFFHGRQVTRYLESYLGDRIFQDLKVPVKIVATDVTGSQAVVFETGRVVDALRASISIPGIFRPFRYRNSLLIDGGILDPLPVDVLTKMGVKKIIAVNVLMGPDDRIQKNRIQIEKRRKILEARSHGLLWRYLLAPLMKKLGDRYSSNIFNIIMHTIQFMEYEIAEVSGQEADVLIHPVIHDAHWAEFYRSEKFIQAGEQKTLEQIDEIKRLLVE